MQMHPITFPPDRRNDPKRRAEARVFDEINASRLSGFAHYEWQRDHNSPQLDVALWLLNVGRFGVDIKGGHYFLEKGKWYLKTDNGPQKKACPLRKAWDATMSLHDELVDVLDHEAFFIAVLVFPDMEPDQDIIDRAERSNVHVLWGTDGLMDRLEQIAAAREVYNPPDAKDIAREVAAVTDDQILYEPTVDGPPRQDEAPLAPEVTPESRMDVTAGSITIQHVDTLNVYTVSGLHPNIGEAPGIDGLQAQERPAGG